MIDRHALLAALAADLGAGTTAPADGGDAIVVADRARTWLVACEAGAPGPAPADLDAVCRQIDVRRRISATYRPGWKRADPEAPAADAVVTAVVAVLLAVAARGGDHGRDLKLVNSALKALDLTTDDGRTPALRAWAVELLDRATIGDGA
jgi:hypothetical protein